MMHFIFKETTRPRNAPVNSEAGQSTGPVDQRGWPKLPGEIHRENHSQVLFSRKSKHPVFLSVWCETLGDGILGGIRSSLDLKGKKIF